ncbi:MAG: serine/threonine protein kinase [Myxococcota bacterium]
MNTASQVYKKREYERLLGKEINGRYDLESLLGFGGMGAVYQALQRNMERRVALKLIPQGDPKAAARFKREALTVSKLQHPNTVTVFDYGQTDDGMLFLAMEMLSGRTLGDVIEHEAPLDPKRAVHIASQVCRSLTEAHAAGIVHRDIKPENIFLIEVDEDSDFVKVLDFGIAKSLQAEDEVTLTGEGRIIGTPRYMSPEQILAESVDRRSDIYSLACIVFEMLCGTPPFDDASTTKLMISHAKEPPPPLAERLTEGALSRIPGQLEQVVRRALSKSPSERQSQIEAFRQELERAVEKLESNPIPPGTGMRESPEVAKRQPESSDLLDMHSSQTLDRVTKTRADRKPVHAPEAPTSADTSKDDNTSVLLIAGIILLTLFIIVGGYLAFTEPSSEQVDDEAIAENAAPVEPAAAPEPEQQADDEASEMQFDESEAAAPTTFALEITSPQSGVTVFQGDEEWGKTPLEREIDADTESIELRFEKNGYKTRTRTLNVNVEPGGQKSIDVSLSKEDEKQRRSPVRHRVKKPADKSAEKNEAPAAAGGDESKQKAEKTDETKENDKPNIFRLGEDEEPDDGMPNIDRVD